MPLYAPSLWGMKSGKRPQLRHWRHRLPKTVSLTLPKGEVFTPDILDCARAGDGAVATVIKDAGDDPDVTHRARISVKVGPSDGGVVFKAGPGVGTVTKAGLPLAVGEPAINPVPRAMMDEVVAALAASFARSPDVTITVSVADGEVEPAAGNCRRSVDPWHHGHRAALFLRGVDRLHPSRDRRGPCRRSDPCGGLHRGDI